MRTSSPGIRRRSGLLRFAAVAALALAAAALPSCRRETADPAEALLEDLRSEKAKVDRKTDELLKALDEYNRNREPGQREIGFTELFAPDMTPAQRNLLDDLLREEKDATYRGLLEEIRRERDEITELQGKILDLESKLPDKFREAQRGDTHYAIALDYLTKEQGLPEQDAREALADIHLFEDLSPGNHVYLFYDRGSRRFGTYVTQGKATASPLAVERAIRRRLVTERDQAIAYADQLSLRKGELERQVAALEVDLRELEDRRSRTQRELEAVRREAERVENSIFYHVASAEDLRERGVVRDTLFTTPQVDEPGKVAYDQSLDLRTGTTIELFPSDYGLEKVKRIIVFPKFFEEGRDYSVEMPPAGAVRIQFLKPDLFRNRRVLIALKGPS